MTANPNLKAVPPVAATQPTATPRKRKLLMMALPVVLLLGGGVFWLMGGRYEETENANLHQARLSVASDLAGRVISVNIADNQTVKKGAILFQVDPTPYKIAISQAEAAMASARLSVEQLKVSYAQAQAQLALSAADAAYQQAEFDRQKALKSKGVASSTALDDAEHLARHSAQARDVAKQTVDAALAALGGDVLIATDAHPAVMAAQSALDRAQYNLDLATVRAPADGVIYQASAFRPGAMVAAGQQLFALVETGDSWVDANFKETQLGGISTGQPVEVVFDALPGHKFEGHVAAIGAGTGAEFSLLPAQNATGNWVKVTQRVPVRIHLEDTKAIASLATGLSAKVTVDTGRSHSLGSLFSANTSDK